MARAIVACGGAGDGGISMRKSLYILAVVLGIGVLASGASLATEPEEEETPTPTPTPAPEVNKNKTTERSTQDVIQSRILALEAIRLQRLAGIWSGPVPSNLSPQSALPGESDKLLASRHYGPGMAAAALGDRASLWASVAWSSFDEDHPTIAFNGDAVSGFLGADYLFTDQFVAGVAVGGENVDVTSTFNAGGSNSDGVTGLAYAALVFNRYFSADASFGYTGVYDIDQRRTAAGVAITGSTDGWRWFGAANLNGRYTMDGWTLSGNVGYLRSSSHTDGFTESNGNVVGSSNTELGQVRIGGRVSYSLAALQSNLPRITPYVSGLFEWDHDRTKVSVAPGQAVPPDDRTDFVVGGGLSFAFSDRVSGGIEATTVLDRANFNSTTVSGNIRFVF